MPGKTKVGPSYMKTDIIYTKKLNIYRIKYKNSLIVLIEKWY